MVANKYSMQSMERVRQLIDERCGGSQQVFADRVDINKASVSQYVNGHNAPTNITAGKIARAFDVNPAWVMGFDVPMIVAEDNDDFRERMRSEYGAIFDLVDKADPDQRQQIEKILDAIVPKTD